MKNILTTVVIALLPVSSAMAGSAEENPVRPVSAPDTRLTSALRATVAKLNQQLSNDSTKVRLFAQLADKQKSDEQGHLVPSNKIVKVLDAKSWPEDTVTSYIALVRNDGTVAVFQEIPVSESGDWFNTYTHYYDEKGKTIAFQRYSSFFNGCPDSPSNETSTYYYAEHRLIAKDYSLLGENNKKIEPDQCDFMYRHDYSIWGTWMETKNASGIGQAW